MIRSWNTIIKSNDIVLKMMSDALAIYDQALYYQRQSYFSSKEEGKIKTHGFVELYNIVKETSVFKETDLDHVVKSDPIRQVCKNWTSFIKATVSFKKAPSKFLERPKMPNYLCKRKKYVNVCIDKTRLRYKNCKDNEFRIPCTQVKIKFPPQIKRESIRQIVLQYYYGKIKVNIIYDEDKRKDVKFNVGSAIGIDPGVNNLCTITRNDNPFSCVVKGGPLKSMNQYYNKKRAEILSKLEICNKKKKSKKLERLSLKRKNKIHSYMHLVSRRVVDMCANEGIETIVIGHNKEWKNESDMKEINNQNFVTIPFDDLFKMIEYKSEEYPGMKVVMVEESYTSKCDHLALETMHHHEHYLGRRTRRGFFKSSTGKRLNADCNGAIGIMRKGNAITDAQLLGLRDRGDVVSPKVFKLNL